MKRIIFQAIFIMLFASGCNNKAREAALDKRELELNMREQQLLIKEKQLVLKEEELNERVLKLDSTIVDSTGIFNPVLVGFWDAKMVCTETSCPGSAIGDTKAENWEIGYENNHLVVKAMTGNKLVRVYTGKYDGINIMLTEDVAEASQSPATKLLVRLVVKDKNNLAGQREILREKDCKIIYSLQLSRQ